MRGGESSAPTLVAVLVLCGPAEGARTNHASMSSKMSATSSGSGVRGGARGTVILRDLRTEGAVVVPAGRVGRGCRDGRRWRGKVGSSCGCGPGVRGIAGRGLLIRLRGPVLDHVLEPREGGGNRESGREQVALDEEDADGEARETTWLSSRAYHDTSSSSTPLACSSESENGANVNSNTSAELALGASSALVDLVITSGWICTRWAAGALRSWGLGLRPGHSSSDVSGVVGMSLLEQADMLVSEGVGERERGGDICRKSRGRPDRGVVTVLLLDSARGGETLTGEVGLVMSITMSKALRLTDWCFCFVGAGLGESRAAERRKSWPSENSSRP